MRPELGLGGYLILFFVCFVFCFVLFFFERSRGWETIAGRNHSMCRIGSMTEPCSLCWSGVGHRHADLDKGFGSRG